MLLGRAHLARQLKRVGGRVCGCAKLLAGTLRCLRLVDFSLGVDLTRNNWGVAPNPTRELRPLTPPRDSVGRFVILCPRVYRFSRVFIPFNRPCPLTSVKK